VKPHYADDFDALLSPLTGRFWQPSQQRWLLLWNGEEVGGIAGEVPEWVAREMEQQVWRLCLERYTGLR